MASASATPAQTRSYLTFVSNGRIYAFPSEDVIEVIRTPSAARVPMSPAALIGLANYRGSVLPLVSLRRLLGQDEAPGTGARAIVFSGSAPAALMVDGVEFLVSMSPDRVASAQAELAAEPGEKLAGAFPSGRNGAVKILDIQALLSGAFPRRQERPKNVVVRLGGREAPRPTHSTTRSKPETLITFAVADQEYALALYDVEEVVPLPSVTTPLPRAEALVIGVMSHRDHLLPLLSLRILLGFIRATALEGGEKVIVAVVRGVEVGLVVDGVNDIVSAEPEALEPVPRVLAARAGRETRLKAIYRGEGGKRIVAVLSPELLFAEDVMARLESSGSTVRSRPVVVQQPEAQFVVFQLDGEEFGLPVDAVEEVARAPNAITPVPNAPAFLEGVVNLRGELLPVVDQRRRFGMPRFEGGRDRRLIVVRTNGRLAGLIVDAVSEVRRCRQDSIEPPPDLTQEMSRLVRGVLNLTTLGRIIMVLDPLELLTHAEQGSLESFATTGLARA